jgi:elongation factor 1-beta
MGGPPRPGEFSHLRRWYRHIASFDDEFAFLPDADLNAITLGETSQQNASEVERATEADGDEDIDLFGSDEEDDEEVIRAREQRFHDYQERQAARPKPAAKTEITLDIKPWGKKYINDLLYSERI